MRVSMQWVSQYVSFALPPVDELVARIGAQLGAVEEVEHIGDLYRGVRIVKVVACRKHPQSDHLHICLVDDGGKTPGVERGADGFIQVVCGAPNVRVGMLAAWLAPGVTVPESIHKSPFVLEAGSLRGEQSNGMLASPRELVLGDSHDGILELDGDVQPGDDFAAAYGLDDTIIDIENKMFTHRPDCFGVLGVAREIAGILGQQFTSPDWYVQGGITAATAPEGNQSLPLTVQNDLPSLVPRFMVVPLSGVQVRPSPVWLQTYLVRSGVRPINNVVDVTNYLMLLTGQPLHAYDYDKVKALGGSDQVSLTVRYPRGGEQIVLLNGKTITPRAEAMMVAAENQLLCVGGVMGGTASEVDESTRNVILEVGSWDMYAIRRTAMAHGLFTDAVTRFNKGQSPLQNDVVLAKAVALLSELTGAVVAGSVIDDNHVDPICLERHTVHPPVAVTVEFINERLGLALTAVTMQQLLGMVEFNVTVEGDQLLVHAPFWRTDIELPEDVVEEVGRLHGFDKLPVMLPWRHIAAVSKDPLLMCKQQVRTALAVAGANEVLTYSFVHGDVLRRAGQDPAEAYQLSNALSPDLQYYRLSLQPSLLDKVHMNVRAGYGEFALFELGKAHGTASVTADGLPTEFERLAFVYTCDDKRAERQTGAAYYEARVYVERLFHSLGLRDSYTLVPAAQMVTESTKKDPLITAMLSPFALERSAVICDGGRIRGVIGEYAAGVRRAFKLPIHSAGFELELPLLLGGDLHSSEYEVLPRFPRLTQDMTLRVASSVPYGELALLIRQELTARKPTHTRLTVDPLAIYQPAHETTYKQVSFRITLASYERTLQTPEVTELLDIAAATAHERLQAERV